MFYKVIFFLNVDFIYIGIRDMYFFLIFFNLYNILLCNLFDLKIVFLIDIKGYFIFICKVFLGFFVKWKIVFNVLRGFDG